MYVEVRSIPPAPRRVRTAALLAHRWPLLAIGGAMVVLGSLIAWAMFLQSGGKLSLGPSLDAGPTEVVRGTVETALDPRDFEGRSWQDVRYRFAYDGVGLYGGCFVPSGSVQVGDAVDVEVLVGDPNVNRIRGGLLHIDWKWLRARFWVMAMTLPGGLILLGWLAGVFQLRQVLVYGDVSAATILSVTPLRHVLPEMLAVGYEFRDHRARPHRNLHWVRARGPLGERLRTWRPGGRREVVPVLHDRRLPQWNRLLLPQDFAPSPDTTPQPRELT